MWLLIFATLAALAAPEWSEIVERTASPIDVRWSTVLGLEAYAERCATVDPRACALQAGDDPRTVFAASCAKGDVWSCLGVAWLDEATEPEASFETYQRLCAAGSQRACGDVARARRDGIGTWASLREARRLAEPLCAAGEGVSCMVLGSLDRRTRPLAAEASFVRAIELGTESGVGGLLRISSAANVGRLRDEACDAGLGWACLAAALAVREEDLDRSEELLERGCDLRDPDSCLTLLLLRREREIIDEDQALESLDAMCAREQEEACVQANFLRYGGEVKAFTPGEVQPIRATALRDQLVPYYLECYRALIDRDRSYAEAARVEVWVQTDGIIRGVSPVAPDADEEYRTCLAENTLGRKVWKPKDGAARVAVKAEFGHEADVVVSAKKGKDGTEQVLALEGLLREEHADDLEQCYLDNGGSPFDSVFTWVYGTVDRNGAFRYEKLVESSSIEEADACIQRLVDGLDVGATYAYDESVRVYVHFGIMFSLPKKVGFGHGTSADPDTYLNDPWLNLPE